MSAEKPASGTMKTSDYFALTFGMIIGVGWLTVMGFWLSNAGPIGASIAFIIGMVLFIPVGLCYAEMAGVYPHAGGPITYALNELGVFTSFMTGWMLCIVFLFVVIFEALSVGWLMEVMFPSLLGPLLYSVKGSDIYLGHVVVGIGINFLLCLVNLRGGASSGKFQTAMTITLLTVVLVLIGAALTNGKLANLQPYFVESETLSAWPGIMVVLMTVPFYLTGFEVIAQGVSERHESVSARTVANIVVLAIISAGVFYVAVILSASAVAPREALLGAELVTAKAFEIGLGSSLLMKAALFGGLLGLLSTWNASIFVFLRGVLALSRCGMIAKGFSKTSPAGVSRYGVALLMLLTSLGVLLGKNAIISVINSSSTAIGIMFFIVCFSVIVSRLKKPDLSRPYRIRGGFLVPGIGCLVSLSVVVLTFVDPYLSAGAIPLEWWLFGGSLLLGVVFWFLGHKDRSSMNKADMVLALAAKAP